jgi:hypothetical protein
MSLQQRLDRIKAGFEAQAPKEALEVMHRATEDLRASGIAERALAEGQMAPDFRLEGTTGTTVSLAEARIRGPVVLTFFRGHW